MSITQEKAERIAQEYAKTGFLNQEQTLKKCGYSDTYARSGLSNRIYSNVLVKAEIAKIRTKTAKKQENTRENVTIKMFELGQKAEKKGDLTNAVRIYEDLGKNCGWFAEDNAQQQESKELTKQQRLDQDEYNAWKLRQLIKPHKVG